MQHRRRSIPLSLLTALIAAALAAGCNGSSGGGSTAAGAGSAGGAAGTEGQGLAVGWIFPGRRDGAAIAAVDKAFPDVSEVVTENAGPDAAAGLVSQGAKLLIDAGSGACEANPNVHCVEATQGGQPPASTIGFGSEFWNRAYLLGKAAGLLTQTDFTGFVSSGDSPTENAAVNAWALGCQSSDPNCRTLLVHADAGGAAAAAKKLIKQRADVLATTLGGAELCRPSRKDVVAIQPVLAAGDPCGRGINPGDLGAVAVEAVKSELGGSFQGGRSVPLPLGVWGPQVPADVRQKVETASADIAAGKKVFAGPLFDNEGNQRVPAGQELLPAFIASQWTWLLGGVLVEQ